MSDLRFHYDLAVGQQLRGNAGDGPSWVVRNRYYDVDERERAYLIERCGDDRHEQDVITEQQVSDHFESNESAAQLEASQ